MAKLTRKTASIFGSTASVNQIAKFGSLAAASPVLYSGATADAATIQSLSNWLQGWFGAVEAGNSPAIEDMNAFCFVMAYQIAYQMQEGIPEWDSATIYYKGSLANDGGGNIYVSIADNNTNHILTNASFWWPMLLLNNSGFYSGLSAPAGLAANYSLTLPLKPAVNSTVALSSSGAFSTITRAVSAAAALGEMAVSAANVSFSTASITLTSVPSNTITIVSSGRPIRLALSISSAAVDDTGYIGIFNNSGSSQECSIEFVIRRTSGSPLNVAYFPFRATIAATGTNFYPCSSCQCFDYVAAGSYAYAVQARVTDGTGTTVALSTYTTLTALEES